MLQSLCAYQGAIGIVVFTLIAFAMSENKKKLRAQPIILGIIAQFFLFIVLTKVPCIKDVLFAIAAGICRLKDATEAATSFVFGYVGGGATPFDVKSSSNLFILAFQVLPMLMVISALTMLLFHWRIMQFFVKSLSFLMQKTLKLGGALGIVAAAKIFLGQTEVPFLVRPYLSKLTKHELFTIITCGMATTSGMAMVLYATILDNVITNALNHILIATVMGIFSAIWISRIVVPQSDQQTFCEFVSPYKFSSAMEAISRGTSDGLRLWANVIAILVVMLALVKLLNIMLGVLPDVCSAPITIERILGFIIAPIAWTMGIPWSESGLAGNLIGIKTVLNEIVAFIGLSETYSQLSEKARIIMVYGLCGFANFGSIGIVIEVFGNLSPERKDEVMGMSVKAMITGAIATCLSATVAGIVWDLLG
ncbi:MAG: nucleoside:proton symporter [Holosporales bacterium]|jgi:CNT family concentrative nucleoside transporter|nr:nucleoside:proton symporter [Holosporales bacterium]